MDKAAPQVLKLEKQLVKERAEMHAKNLRLEQNNALLLEKLQRWKQFFEQAMAAKRENVELKRKLDAAYAELRKQRPAITAVFDRSVWDAAEEER